MEKNKESGVVMLESTFCVLAVMAVVLLLLGLGFFLYQYTLVGIVANEVAEDVSQTYKLRDVEDDSTLEAKDISGIGKYRYLMFSGSFDRKNGQKAEAAVRRRLPVTSLAEEEGRVKVDVKTVVDGIGRRHYEVTVSQKYNFFMGDLLRVIGRENSETVSRTVYVESSDVLNMTNTVRMVKYFTDEISESDLGKMADNLLSVVNTVEKLIKGE